MVEPIDPQVNLLAGIYNELMAQGMTKQEVTDYLNAYFASSIQASSMSAMPNLFYADSPALNGYSMSSLYDDLYATHGEESIKLYLANRQSEMISAILDEWSKSISENNERSREASKKNLVRQEEMNYMREQADIVQEDVKRRSAEPLAYRGQLLDAAFFNEYLRDLPMNQREAVLGAINSSRDPASQNQDLSKAVMPLVALEVFVIVPAAQSLVMAPVENLSSQIAVNPIADQTVLDMSYYKVMQTEMMPLINFFATQMFMETTAMLYIRSVGEGGKPAQNMEFARTMADQVLSKIQMPGYIEGELLRRVDSFEQMPLQQKEAAVLVVKMFLLVNVLMLFTHIEGGVLSPEELKEMLLEGKGIPEGGKREELIVALHDVIQSVPEELRGDFVEAMLAYLDSMPDAELLTSQVHAINAATQSVIIPEGAA